VSGFSSHLPQNGTSGGRLIHKNKWTHTANKAGNMSNLRFKSAVLLAQLAFESNILDIEKGLAEEADQNWVALAIY
jgi:hypothetical protein